jgi:dTMP kinase
MGTFITFEGGEGSGKSSCIERFKSLLPSTDSLPVMFTREPGASRIGKVIRSALLDMESTDLTPTTELFLYLADRAQHVGAMIKPVLEQDGIVISDRFADSAIVYQGYSRGLDVGHLFHLNDIAVEKIWPDMTIYFDVDPVVGITRARKRNITDGTATAEGRFEAEQMEFHIKVRNGYLDWAKKNPDRFRIVDANKTKDEVFDQVFSLIQNLLREKLGERSPL